MEAANDSSSAVMENYSDDDGAGGEATRPMIAQGLVNCGDDDNDRMVERLPRIVACDDGDGNGAGGEAVENSSTATGGGNSSSSCVVKQSN